MQKRVVVRIAHQQFVVAHCGRRTQFSRQAVERLLEVDSGQTAGVVLVRQRPEEEDAIFITLEDKTGITNVLL